MRVPVLVCLLCALFCSVSSETKSKTCDAGDGYCDANSEATPKGANIKGEPDKVDLKACADRHPDMCPEFLANGECEKNPGWMIVNWYDPSVGHYHVAVLKIM